ncbi:hypothetical protein [Kitasatospora sp. NPDC051914]|uniref:hypothetical protein n=1 Tax=Kitasatospora sp. NPDC051914 TaxID=3154945 RepID=UPI0034290B53
MLDAVDVALPNMTMPVKAVAPSQRLPAKWALSKRASVKVAALKVAALETRHR